MEKPDAAKDPMWALFDEAAAGYDTNKATRELRDFLEGENHTEEVGGAPMVDRRK